MSKKLLWGHEFTLVKNGLAEEEVESLIRTLGTSANTWLEQAHHLNKLKDLSERMKSMVGEVTETLRKVQEDSAQSVKQEKESMLAEAKKASDSMVSQAKEAAHSVKEQAEEAAQSFREQAEEVANKRLSEAEKRVKELEEEAGGVEATTLAAQEEAQGIVVEAKERAKGIVMEAKEKALAIDEEAREHAEEVYSDSKEQAEVLMAKGFERIQKLMENESESLLQSLGSIRKGVGQKGPHDNASQDDEAGASEENKGESEPAKSQSNDGEDESSQGSPREKDTTSDRAKEESIVKGGANSDLQDSPVAAVSKSSANNGHQRDIRETPQSADEGTLYKGSVQILLPSDAHMLSLWSVQEALEGVEGVTIKEQISSADETSIVVFAQSPVPLIDILRGLPDVSKVEEENEEEVAAGGFFGSRQNKGFGAGLAMRKLRLTFPIKSRE